MLWFSSVHRDLVAHQCVPCLFPLCGNNNNNSVNSNNNHNHNDKHKHNNNSSSNNNKQYINE